MGVLQNDPEKSILAQYYTNEEPQNTWARQRRHTQRTPQNVALSGTGSSSGQL